MVSNAERDRIHSMWAVGILIASTTLIIGEAFSIQECVEYYQRFSVSSTYCLPPNRSCNILSSSISSENRETILREHNKFRSRIAMGKESKFPKASNMIQMVWDYELAEGAQKHANQCVADHDCITCRQTKHFRVGQNIQTHWQSDKMPMPNWPHAINRWFAESSNCDVSRIKSYLPRSKKKIGHFTQLVWADTWKVGCGYTVFLDDKNLRHQLYTCNYGPGGNTVRESVYDEGKVCSKCPINSCCGTTCSNSTETPSYEGLCRITSGNPVYPSKWDLWDCDITNITKDCRAYRQPKGMEPWKLYDSTAGSYIGTELHGGQNTVLKFKKSFVLPEVCLGLIYRKGPTISTAQSANNVSVDVYSKTKKELPLVVKIDSLQFTKREFEVEFQGTFQVGIAFSVPEGMPKQFLEIRRLAAKAGKCK